MFSRIIFQGRELDVHNLIFSLGPEVVRSIEDRFKKNENAMVGSSSIEVDLFRNITLPSIKPYEYVRRQLEYQGVISYQQDTCWQSFEAHLGKFLYRKKDQHDIFAVTWSEQCECTSGETCGQSIEKVSKIFENGSFHGAEISNGTERPEKKIRVVALDDENNPGLQLEMFSNHVKPHIVHWLHASPPGFVWEKTENGSVSPLRSRLSTVIYDEDSFLSGLVQHARKRVICISGEAGMGKTTFLQATAVNIKAKHKDRLVCYMTCERLGEILNILHATNGVKSMSILVLVEVLARGFNLRSELEKNILKCLISTCDSGRSPKIELFLDGFEDLNPRCRKMLLKYFKEEQQWCFRVWLTTRTYLKHYVENELDVISYELCPFEKTDIISCFRRVSDYCSNHEFCACKNVGKARLAELLVSKPLENFFKINLVGLLANPRHLKSIFKLMMQNRIRNPFVLKSCSIMKAVIEGMIEAYLDKHTSQERNDAEEKVPEIMKKYASLAAQLYLNKRLENGDLLDLLCNADSDLYEFGLIERNRESRVWFVHNAFPAYLLADYFTIALPSNTILINFFLNQVLYEDMCEDVRMFYEQKLTTEIVDGEILDAWGELIQKFLITFHNLSDHSFKHGRTFVFGTVLHLAIIDKRIGMAKLLIKSLTAFPAELRRLINRKMKVTIDDNDYEARMVGGNETEKSTEMSALSLAIMFGDTELVDGMYTLLEEEEERVVNEDSDGRTESFTSLDSYHFTPTHLAVIGCNMNSFIYLSSERRLSVTVADLRGHLPIHLIFYNRWNFQFLILPPDDPNHGQISREIKICRYYNDLEEDGGDLNVKDRSGRYPILASQMTTPLTQMMMKNNFNFESKDDSDAVKTTTHYKCALSYLQFMEKLAGRTLLNFKPAVDPLSPQISPPLHLACMMGHMPMIKSMMMKKVNINIRDRNELSALFFAVFYGRADITKYLLNKGINRSDLDNWVDEAPLLHSAALKGHLKMVRYMLTELGISKNIKNDEGLTALHKVCHAGRLDSTKLLLELGTEVNAKDRQKQTPLHLACSTGANFNVELVQLLIEYGADVNCKTIHGKTALHLVAEEGNVELLNVLFETGKMDPNITTNHGRTPLHFACSKPANFGAVKILVTHGANLNEADVNGQTPMHVMAICHAAIGMAKFLIRAGGNVYVKDKYGETPLSELLKHNEEVYHVVTEQINYVPCRYTNGT